MSTTYKPLIVLPTYNHYKALPAMLTRLKTFSIDILIVNDGSRAEVTEKLKEICCEFKIRMVMLSKNRGKGGAVKAGVRYAFREGYTHLIQIDADGQHNLDSLEDMVAASKAAPEKMVLTRPIYDISKTPKARLWGRKISTFWIALETLSLDIKDGLCGFRIYPVDKMYHIISNTKVGDRMDFDPEILIHLRWAKTGVSTVDTTVTYQHEEESNFRMVKDNVLISFVYMRLFWVGLFKLLTGGITKSASKQWSSQKERGNILGIKLTLWGYRLLGKSLTLALFQPVLLYFFLTDKKGRDASFRYHKRVQLFTNSSTKPTLLTLYRQYVSFATSLLDKFAVRIPKKAEDFRIEVEGFEQVLEVAESGRGALFIGAHAGNFDVLRLLAEKKPELMCGKDISIKALMYRKHAALINSVFKGLNGAEDQEIIALESITIGSAGTLIDEIEKGTFLGILGDREAVGSEKTFEIPFLGAPAQFPQGPWILANILQCPVIFFSSAHVGGNSYKIHFKTLYQQVRLGRKERDRKMKEFALPYVEQLEQFCAQYPEQWYNFYDFWNRSSSESK